MSILLKTPQAQVSKIKQESPFVPSLEFIPYEKLRPILQKVQRPGRYIGGEFGTAMKDPYKAKLRVLLSYPDTYELGMSNEGLRILYDCVNREPDLMADRAYLPWPDFQKEMEVANIPLYSLESFLSARSFDIWGFNLCHEMHFTNLCYALDLAQLPIWRKERKQNEPFIIVGGTATSNPFPLFDFADGIFLGDGEEGIIEICEMINTAKQEAMSRQGILEELQSIESLLLPAFYKITDRGLGHYPDYHGPKVKKRNYRSRSFSALKYAIVPNIGIVQDRVVIEVARGCGQGCRFCHAGFWKRPVRNSEVRTLVETAGEMLKKTGHNTISLHSLSIADYPWLEELVVEMANSYGEKGVSLSLPSLRVQVKTIPVLEMTAQIRRSNVTFALEAGSELQRERIRKKSSEENLHYLMREIYTRGWDLVKVYFMLGLPDNDGNEVVDLIKALNALGKIAEEYGPKKHVNITVSLFVPKAFTTFQWEKQQTPEYFRKALQELHSQLCSKRVRLKGPSPEMPYVEGLLSRSDHRIGKWIYEAYRRGARFDSWDDQFNPQLWLGICEEIPPLLFQLWMEQKPPETPLPWHSIIDGVKPELLYRDYKRYESINEENMKPPHPQALQESDFPPELLQPIQIPSQRFQTKSVLAVHYTKTGQLIYTSHLETAEIFRRASRRAELPMVFSQGYNKKEKFHFYDTLPLYLHSKQETFYTELYEETIDIRKKTISLEQNLPTGLALLSLELLPKLPLSQKYLSQKRSYLLEFQDKALASQCYEKIIHAPSSFEYERPLKKKKLRSKKQRQQKNETTKRDLGNAIDHLQWLSRPSSFSFALAHPSTGAISMQDLLLYYLGLKHEAWNVIVQITRLPEKADSLIAQKHLSPSEMFE